MSRKKKLQNMQKWVRPPQPSVDLIRHGSPEHKRLMTFEKITDSLIDELVAAGMDRSLLEFYREEEFRYDRQNQAFTVVTGFISDDK